jgi:hypothetical protein
MKKEEKIQVAEALGASRIVEVGSKGIGGPLDLLALRAEFGRRLRSSGGRPTDPAWTVSRQVPFKDNSWSRLQGLASEVGATGHRVGPAQVAALLIESSLEDLDDEEWLQTLTDSRETPLLSEPAAADAAMLSYNQFDDWVQREWIIPAARHGRQLSFSADEVVRAVWLRSIAQAGTATVEAVVADVRDSDLAARYLLVTNARDVRTAKSRPQLYRALEAPGSHLVIDQMPERRRLLGLPPLPDGANEYKEQGKIRRAI